jgi:FkbM family methyltransferase
MSKEVLINGKWPLILPESSAQEWLGNMSHHIEWEKERLDALHDLIKPGDKVLYIGAYKGDMAALLASWGAELIIVEGTSGFWSLIKETWELNGLPKPLAMFSGLISNQTTSELTKDQLTEWPERSELFVEGTTGFAHLKESANHFPEITIDDLCARLGVVPDIITIDIEGSELEAMKHAMSIIQAHRTAFLLSVHPEFMFHEHGTYERELHDLLRNNKYDWNWLGYDHEHHWLYLPIK